MVRPPPTSTRTAPRFPHATLFRSVSQPALTRTIKRAEAVLGIELFTRSTRRVALTAAGREFVPLAARFLSDLDIGIRNMRELGGRQRGQIVVACLLRSEEHTSELQSLMRISYAVFCLKKTKSKCQNTTKTMAT